MPNQPRRISRSRPSARSGQTPPRRERRLDEPEPSEKIVDPDALQNELGAVKPASDDAKDLQLDDTLDPEASATPAVSEVVPGQVDEDAAQQPQPVAAAPEVETPPELQSLEAYQDQARVVVNARQRESSAKDSYERAKAMRRQAEEALGELCRSMDIRDPANLLKGTDIKTTNISRGSRKT
jgi:hypothetical protein